MFLCILLFCIQIVYVSCTLPPSSNISTCMSTNTSICTHISMNARVQTLDFGFCPPVLVLVLVIVLALVLVLLLVLVQKCRLCILDFAFPSTSTRISTCISTALILVLMHKCRLWILDFALPPSTITRISTCISISASTIISASAQLQSMDFGFCH
jgi:hypothetical protein